MISQSLTFTMWKCKMAYEPIPSVKHGSGSIMVWVIFQHLNQDNLSALINQQILNSTSKFDENMSDISL